ncbi:arylsulfatase [Polaribacter sp. SA4-12]|uniref:arylsulfatase n=1 Tax=Polaribacter sp. SA4-12 TaxID=1312072 RepID=UPI000B3CEA88|nr:arylsulfatase [Polaribacter sp. SA4-12]ARV16550.1 arylsulfatase [Polaribacter sp. SA4-12]
MKIKVGVIIGLLLLTSVHVWSQNNPKKKPNIIIVITDDQGKNDLACEGNPYIKTPTLDAFHAEAIRFTNFHVSTTCAPTRASLMTGRHTNRINAYHTIAGRSIVFEDEVMLPQVLANNGYVNGMFGKWHLGDNYPYRPMDKGFQEVVRHGGGGVSQGPDYWANDYFNDTYWKNGVPTKYDGYCTDIFFSEALNFIDTNKDNPFFCYISTNAPHGPFNCPEEYMDMYSDNDKLSEQYQRFYGMITNIDDNFKLLQSKLKKLGLLENTILIFMTDNGSAGGQHVYDAGMTGGKGYVTEGGHRVPFYISWPNGNLTGGKDINELTAHYDILPTFVDLLDLEHTQVKPLDGKSIVPLLKGGNTKWENRILYVDTQREINLVKYKDYSVMDMDWRLINGKELYNVTKDLKQKTNVIEQYPEVAAKLSEGYENWWQSFMDEGVNERYAYIKVGTKYENPARIMSHDMITGKLGWAWHQHGAIEATQASGHWKIEFVQDGKYKISLRRFPRESGLAINDTFPEGPRPRRLARYVPASTKSDFVQTYLYLGRNYETKKIEADAEEVTYTIDMSSGKYNMEAQLIDSEGRVHPAYYVYIEKL